MVGYGNLLFALMYKDKGIFEKVLNELKMNFGSILAESNEYNFNFTNYYEKEFGKNLKKIIMVFDKKIDDNDLVNIKLKCSEIEEFFSEDKKRMINIDVGYLNKQELVLASFKKKDFKQSIGKNVYSHKVLEFKDGKAKEFWHTFPDYKEEKIKKFLSAVFFDSI